MKCKGQEHDHLFGNSGDGRHCGGMRKGNRSPPLSEEKEDWEIWMSGDYDEGGRQGISKDWGVGGLQTGVGGSHIVHAN